MHVQQSQHLHLKFIIIYLSLSQNSDRNIAVSNTHVKTIAAVVNSMSVPLGQVNYYSAEIIGSMLAFFKCILFI